MLHLTIVFINIHLETCQLDLYYLHKQIVYDLNHIPRKLTFILKIMQNQHTTDYVKQNH